ncbi:MAG: hypothetical protein BJ554DRAFT_2748, partial [Olpidium bornovanus]
LPSPFFPATLRRRPDALSLLHSPTPAPTLLSLSGLPCPVALAGRVPAGCQLSARFPHRWGAFLCFSMTVAALPTTANLRGKRE